MSSAVAVVLVVGAGFCAAVVAIVHSLAADEIRAWMPYLARRLVRSAARRLPVDMRARFEGDWSAEIAAWQDRPLSALAKAAHIRWKANAIRRSLGGASLGSDRLKRVFDIGFAVALLVLLAPVLIATAIAIKLESRGPVFFRQPRAGRGDRSFALFKFRSMYVEGEHREVVDALPGVLFKIREDPRVTRVGRFIRRFSLDDLPQLFNVLLGDMSLVGPRPLTPAEIKALDEDERRQKVEQRPGIAGSLRLFLRKLLGLADRPH